MMTSQSILCLWAALEFSFLMFRIGWGFLRGHFQVNSLLSEWFQPVGLLFFQFPCWKWFYRHKLLTSTVLGSSTIVWFSVDWFMSSPDGDGSTRVVCFYHLKQLIEPGTVTLVILELFHLSVSFGGQNYTVTFCNKLFKFWSKVWWSKDTFSFLDHNSS